MRYYIIGLNSNGDIIRYKLLDSSDMIRATLAAQKMRFGNYEVKRTILINNSSTSDLYERIEL